MTFWQVYGQLDEVYKKDEELKQQERSRSRMASEERSVSMLTRSKYLKLL